LVRKGTGVGVIVGERRGKGKKAGGKEMRVCRKKRKKNVPGKKKKKGGLDSLVEHEKKTSSSLRQKVSTQKWEEKKRGKRLRRWGKRKNATFTSARGMCLIRLNLVVSPPKGEKGGPSLQ